MRSAMRCTGVEALKQTVLLALTLVTTRFGMSSLASKLRFEVGGWDSSQGQTVANPDPVALVAVTFNTTAVAAPAETGEVAERSRT